MPDRLSSLDGAFLRVETPSAHMHVAWKGLFAPRDPARGPVTIDEARRAVGARLRHAPRFRQRLAFPAPGFGEPVWVDDPGFDIARHVVALDPSVRERLPRRRFNTLCDTLLSTPLPRDRPLWRIAIAPRLDDGSLGLLMQIHHAMVDGMSAVELALLLLDAQPDAQPPPGDDGWAPLPAPSTTQLTLEALADAGAESLRAVRSAARLMTAPGRGLRLADTLRRTALAVGEDVLRPAPASYVNPAIGPERTLVHHTAALEPLLAVKRSHGVTLNDVALTVVAGALRSLSLSAGLVPRPLKVMVPVSTRSAAQSAALGNRIAFAFVELPVHRRSPADRLSAIHAATSRFKARGRPAGSAALMGAIGMLPEPLRDSAARLASSARLYNLTVSNVPGPRFPVYLLGCELREAAPVIPLPEDHALAIGVFTYRDRITFAGYADPQALPVARELPGALSAAVLELDRAGALPARGWSSAA